MKSIFTVIFNDKEGMCRSEKKFMTFEENCSIGKEEKRKKKDASILATPIVQGANLAFGSSFRNNRSAPISGDITA